MNKKQRIRLLGDGRFRVRIEREGNLAAIHYERYYDDTDTWGITHKTIRLPKEDIKAAAELLGIV